MKKPLNGQLIVTNPFGTAGSTQWYSFHNGVDIRARLAKVYAPEDGYIDTYYSQLGGKTIILKGKTGWHYFHHLSGYIATSNVKEGDLIAISGNTGKWTTGFHLHWGLKINNSWVDPLKYIKKGVDMLDNQDKNWLINNIKNLIIDNVVVQGNKTREEVKAKKCVCSGGLAPEDQSFIDKIKSYFK